MYYTSFLQSFYNIFLVPVIARANRGLVPYVMFKANRHGA
jgi:hypothetical protein